MTDLATALASSPLGEFEGLPVIAAGITIPGAAGGLQPAMKIDPTAFHKGDEVHVVLRCIVDDVKFESIVKDDPRGAQRRVHVFRVTDATFVDAATVATAIDAQRLAIAKAKEDAAGIQRFDWGDPDTAALIAEHDDGQHTDLTDGCPKCQDEIDAKAAEDA